MSSIIKYKGYTGRVDFSEADGCFYGKVTGIHPLISFEGESVSELLDDFHAAIDHYLSYCEAVGEKPETPLEVVQLDLEVTSDLQRRLEQRAESQATSLDDYIQDVLEQSVATV